MKTELYFIAILPPPEIRDEVKDFKLYAKTHFNSERALRSPAHITLIPPFRWPPQQLQELHTVLSDFAKTTEGFYQELKDFDCFEPRVIFVDVVENEALNKMQLHLQQELVSKLDIQPRMQYGFHPHMTIAFKDLKRSIFPDAWQYFSAQSYERLFAVNAICLLHWEQDHWAVVRQYALK